MRCSWRCCRRRRLRRYRRFQGTGRATRPRFRGSRCRPGSGGMSVPHIPERSHAGGGGSCLHHDIRAVWLEGYAVVAIVDVRVLDGDAGGSVRIPSVFFPLPVSFLGETEFYRRKEGSNVPVFLAGFLLVLPPAMSMLSYTTSVELMMTLYHCGLYRIFKSLTLPPFRPTIPSRIGRRM